MGEVDVSGTVNGYGTLTGNPRLVYYVGGSAIGFGTLSGVPVQRLLTGGTVEGAGTTTGNPGLLYSLGGQTTGFGTLEDQLELIFSGTTVGSGNIEGGLWRIRSLVPFPVVGSGTLEDISPLPMVGWGDLRGYVDVIRFPCPFPPRFKTFRWNHTFQIGDLELHTKDAVGLPYSPVVVLYTLYNVLHGGVPVVVGNPNRRPVQQGVGYYYVTGTAGEGGQPGEWIIEWRWQRFWYEQPRTYREKFDVHDAVLAGECYPGRKCKKGWL